MAFIFDSLALDLVSILVTLTVIFLVNFKRRLQYWERIGLEHIKPENTLAILLRKVSSTQNLVDIYKQFKAKGLRHGGAYSLSKPFYVPVDPEIIKCILQQDFEHFMNHGNFTNIKDDPLAGHLFNLEDAKWRNMRVKLTPTFTSGKMKMMFQTLADCAVSLKDVTDKFAQDRSAIDIKDILARFTTDIIGSCAFGIECNSLKNPDAEFRKYGRKAFELDSWGKFRMTLLMTMPYSILKLCKFRFTDYEVEKFFMKAVEDTVRYREENNIYRKDFMHLLLQLKNRGTVTEDEKITSENGSLQALTMKELAAQAFVFFLAGFETSSTTMTFALYELAMNTDIQEKVRNEINTVLAKYNGKLTYDGIMEMTYMDMVLKETLRIHPPLPLLLRICTKDYEVPGTGIRLEKGTTVRIPSLALHMDPEYYPNPEVFDPQRFSDENKNSRPSCTWLPFGEGPRTCIGLRFGLMQSKVGLVTLVKNYNIKLNAKTKLPLEMDKSAFITSTKGGMWLELEKIN